MTMKTEKRLVLAWTICWLLVWIWIIASGIGPSIPWWVLGVLSMPLVVSIGWAVAWVGDLLIRRQL